MVTLVKKRFLRDLLSDWGRILYHIAVVSLSAAIALSLPFAVSFIAKNILVYWAIIRDEKLFVISVEMTLGVFFILFFNSIGRSWRERKLSNMARRAGFVSMTPAKGLLLRRRTKNMKEKKGFAKDVMVIGSMGFRTFVDSKGDLHHVIQHCREAKIMLLNPFGEGASICLKSILDPDIAPESFREQISKSIAFFKGLKAAQKNIRLKLYDDSPLFKLTILDDHMWIQHYHAGLDIHMMPEYVFKHDQNLGSLYNPFYQYFLKKWNHPDVPEYDLDTDELIYRDTAGNEARREKFLEMGNKVTSNTGSSPHLVSKNDNPQKRSIHSLVQTHRNHASIEGLFKNVW